MAINQTGVMLPLTVLIPPEVLDAAAKVEASFRAPGQERRGPRTGDIEVSRCAAFGAAASRPPCFATAARAFVGGVDAAAPTAFVDEPACGA